MKKTHVNLPLVLLFASIISLLVMIPVTIQTLDFVTAEHIESTSMMQPEIALSKTPTPPFLTSTPTPTNVQTPTATPYVITFNGFLYCRTLPDTSTKVITIIRGQPFTIISQDQTENWFLVKVYDIPEVCWIYRHVHNLNVNSTEIVKIPTYVVTVMPTFTFPSP